ncbi:MAG: 2-dehydropantoate 2-reductase [Candidatus Eremiobacteraeota bacterium]|nr:2-dehydropantoate 2-reductase [Candidatus Eremiobacteraeota bacterium]
MAIQPKVAVLGAGAVGSFFGGMLARSGVPVTLIGRRRHVDAIEKDGLLIDGVQVHERVHVAATTDPSGVRGADLVLFCVKSTDTESAAKELALHLRNSALVLSLQNGVDNAERIEAASGIDAIPVVVYVAASIPSPGVVKHAGAGNLIVGGAHRRPELDPVAVTFEKAGVPCRISETIETELWTKLILNCAYNAISALTQARYGRISADPHARAVMLRATREALAVAHASGVALSETDTVESVLRLADRMPEATSSTAQDIARGAPTEIDALNGYLVRRGAELGVEVPVNQALYALVKLLSEKV